MGQKVNPHGLRVGLIKDWDSKWFAGKREFGDQLVEDHEIRKYVKKVCFNAGIAKIGIERKQNRVFITIYAAKPGIIIGRGGAEIARTEQYHEGTIPLQTLRADIDYGFAEAKTTYGILGVKVWIYKGEILNVAEGRKKEAEAQAKDNKRRDNNRRRGDKPARRPNGEKRERRNNSKGGEQ